MVVVTRTARGLGLVVLLMAVGSPLSAQSVQVASLEDALRIGMERNLDLQVSQKRIDVSREGFARTQSLFLPQVGFDLGVNRKDAVFSFPATMSFPMEKDAGFFFGYKTEVSGRLQVSQPVFSASNSSRRSAARLGVDSQETARALDRLDVELAITHGYYTVLLMQQVVQIKEALIEQAKRHQAVVEKRLAQGDVARFDKLRADVQVANLVPELVRSRNAVNVALAQLKSQLGMRQDEELAVKGELAYSPEQVPGPESVKEALAQRPEVQLTSLQRQIAERTLGATRGQWMPSLGAFFTEDLRSDSFGKLFDSQHSNWTVGFSVSVPIFDGGNTMYKAREDRKRIEEAQLAEAQVRRDIEVQVIQAGLELQRAAEVISSQTQNVKQADEALQIANASYASGLVTNFELMDTQVALDQAKIQYITAVYDYLIGRAEFRRATGRK